MEVDILISSSIDTIVSPVNLAGAIGVPPGSKLRLFRDPTNSGQSRLVVHCNKRTASNLRHRFSTLSAYAHEGNLTSLKVVGVRPIFQSREQHREDVLPRAPRDGTRTSATAEEGSGARAELSRICSSAGVEHALDVVGGEANGLLRDVPGIAELYEQFLTPSKRGNLHCSWKGKRESHVHSRDNEEKEGGFETVDEDKSETSSLTEETKQGSSSNGCRSRGGHKNTLSSKRGRCRPQQHRENVRWGEREKKELKKSTSSAVVEHQQRWRFRHVVASVEDVALALARISRGYSDAPRRVERNRVISLLAKLYLDGTAFADNRREAYETLDRLGVVRWYAKAQPQAASRAMRQGNNPPQRLEQERAVVDGNWLRLLRPVLGLVRGIIDFGVFVQLYVAAAEGERPVASRTNDSGEGRTTKTARGEMAHCGGDSASGTSRGRQQRQQRRRRRRRDRSGSMPTQLQAGPGSVQDKVQDNDASEDQSALLLSPTASDIVLPWLFPPSEGGGGGARQAFDRHAVCGGAVHGMITIESAAAIVRDAGKVLPAERAWRYWCCGDGAIRSKEGGGDRARLGPLPRGRFLLLRFQDFVDMCQGLKSQMTNASTIDQQDRRIAGDSTARAAAT